VILCSPHKHHAAQIVAAAKAGKHVFCEKPLCTSAREMEAVAQAVTAAGVQLGIGHERRFEPGIIDLRQRLAAGEFGTALLMDGNFSQDKFFALAPDNWRLSGRGRPPSGRSPPPVITCLSICRLPSSAGRRVGGGRGSPPAAVHSPTAIRWAS
jgi:predicted dehydrogenase